MSCSEGHWSNDFPDTGGICCTGAAVYGPSRCTCWEPVYDLDQTEPDETAVRLLAGGIEPSTRRQMCHDCAYRPDSPERSGDDTYQGDEDFLADLAVTGDRFWCHQGTRRPVKWVHPSGAEHPGHPGGYAPPIVNSVPYKADGTPSELCAGWAARRRALEAKASQP